MPTALIVDAVRTPSGRGKPAGALAGVHPIDLLATTLRAVIDRNGLDPGLVDDVIGGCVTQYDEQATNVTRHACLAAGFPETVPAATIDRQCGSSQQAAHFAAQGVMAGAYDIVIACGVESMSRVPMNSDRPNGDPSRGPLKGRYTGGLVAQGLSAELVAARWGLDRLDLDAYAARSHARASSARDGGLFEEQIVAVGGHSDDETIRSGTTPRSLASLPASFADPSAVRRFPELADWRVTAGNSSPLTDGAAAVLIVSEKAADRLGLRPLGRFVDFAVVGSDPLPMLTGVIPATRKVLTRANLAIGDMDVCEVNEAFASVPLAWAAELRADPDRMNPLGGAIALGHPLGASGARILTTLVHNLHRSGGHYGLMTMCERGGMANATIVGRV